MEKNFLTVYLKSEFCLAKMIYRSLYAYLGKEVIIILSAFIKKTQKTPIKEIQKARNRLKKYL